MHEGGFTHEELMAMWRSRIDRLIFFSALLFASAIMLAISTVAAIINGSLLIGAISASLGGALLSIDLLLSRRTKWLLQNPPQEDNLFITGACVGR